MPGGRVGEGARAGKAFARARPPVAASPLGRPRPAPPVTHAAPTQPLLLPEVGYLKSWSAHAHWAREHAGGGVPDPADAVGEALLADLAAAGAAGCGGDAPVRATWPLTVMMATRPKG